MFESKPLRQPPDIETLHATWATELLASGRHVVLVELLKGKIATPPFAEVVANRELLDIRLLELARTLAQ